ncbi:MAG TPA: pilus assembly protein [Alphaproteobacteria bacterium]|nr:pilus assembly protein [Alphaproteobacteria bacterium]
MSDNSLDKNIKTWRYNRDGSTAVEFALIGIPFIFMVIGIVEMALMFTAQSLLEASTAEAARQIRIGAVQQGGGEDEFIESLCDYASVLIPCGDLQYQVVSMDSFEDAADFPDASFDENGDLEDQQFDAGGVSDVVMIRTAYKYPIKTPMMQLILSNNGDQNRLMLSTIVLQTEPYEFEN